MKKVQSVIKKTVDVLGKFYMILACILLVACVGSAIAGVIARYIFSMPITWVEEFSALVQAWFVCLLIPQLDIRYGHITMNIVFDMMPRALKLVVRIIQSIATCALAYYLFPFAQKVIALNQKLGNVTGTLKLPYTIVYYPLIIMLVFMMVVHIGKLLSGDFDLGENDKTNNDKALKEAEAC